MITAPFLIKPADFDRLWRAQQAVTLLAALNNDVASTAGFSHAGPAAVAEYIRDDMLQILNAAEPADEAANDD